MKRVLLIRFSAIGDVAMLIPVVYSAARRYPETEFTLLTSKSLIPLFINKPENLNVIGADLKGAEKKLSGLLRFAASLLPRKYDAVIDLHNVLRSRVLRLYLKVRGGTPFYALDKGRSEKRRLTRRRDKIVAPLKPTITRYKETFEKASLGFPNNFDTIFDNAGPAASAIAADMPPKEGCWIGLAPFAKHEGKIYSLSKMEEVLNGLTAKGYTFFLFGGRGFEQVILDTWAEKFPRVYSLAGRYPLNEELCFMRQMDLFVSMDSANMHFAALTGIPVVSFWGQTHPYAGFYPWRQSPENALQLSLPCRPCSVFGNKKCYRGDWACLNNVSSACFTAFISDKLEKII